MFGLLNSSQIYGLQQAHEHPNITITKSSNNPNQKHHRRTPSSVSDSGKESKFFASLNSMQGMKSPTNFIEKFLKTELLNSYDTIKNYKNFQHSSGSSSSSSANKQAPSLHPEGILTSFNCLHGSYRSNSDGEFYEAVNVNSQKQETEVHTKTKSPEMTIKCSKNLLAEPPQTQAPATLQNYQKLPDCEEHQVVVSSGASSGEFNNDGAKNVYKKLSFGAKSMKNVEPTQSNEIASDNSSSSISTTTTNSSANTTSAKSNDNLQRTSSASSSGDCTSARERKKSMAADANTLPSPSSTSNGKQPLTPERVQRRKLLQTISYYEQQNKLLQRELAKEKRRRTEELACVVKSLICFESKLKTDMKQVNQRLQEKDVEICRLVRQNRGLRKKLSEVQRVARESVRDEGVVEDDEEAELDRDSDKELLEDCLVLEALQCINCSMQFYDIDLKEGWTQTTSKDGSRKNDDHTTEHGSSSDDTVSSSFYGARRSVRYTSKRTSGTFRDYMHSRSMNIDDPSLDNNSEENTSTISRDDSQTSYEKINVYSRTMERMHGVKGESERESSEQSGLETTRSASRLSSKSSSSRSSKASEKSTVQMEEDDGIFSPTQDDDFDEDVEMGRSLKIVQRRSMEFSEASPKQVYETSTDDWYASASDQEEIGTQTSAKSYGHGAINPVLECVNQILLQQSMEETPHDNSRATDVLGSVSTSSGSEHSNYQKQLQLQLTPKSSSNHHLQATQANLPRRSSLSGRRSSRSNSHSSDGQNSRNGTLTRKRVHFSTKNSMVHVPRNDDNEDEDDDENADVHTELISTFPQQQQQHYHPMNYYPQSATPAIQSLQNATPTNVIAADTAAEHERLDILNYESIYSNEYEPIGSEHNSSNLYVDMESTTKMAVSVNSPLDAKMPKMPPALPPKPANLLKFKKSLQQLDEMPDEQDTTNSEPDYCCISEVNMGMTSVQIVADVHKAPESEPDLDLQARDVDGSELGLEVSTVASDDTCAASQKTDEIEEIFADIPKLPNVAAIIAPKNQSNSKYQSQSDYLVMSPKVETPNMKLQSARKLILNIATPTQTNEFLGTPTKSPKLDSSSTPLKLQLNATGGGQQPQYKRKHVPNILAEINKRMSQPNSPTTPTKATTPFPKGKSLHSPNTLLKNLEDNSPGGLPLQAEFDWYNLDAEYGKAPLSQSDLLKGNESMSGSNMLAEIHEDHECAISTADEYNLDEEFSLAPDKIDESGMMYEDIRNRTKLEATAVGRLNAAICEAVSFPLFSENSPLVPLPLPNAKAKKIKKNLASFEKFIEGTGMSTKPLPSKRKIYFAGPFV